MRVHLDTAQWIGLLERDNAGVDRVTFGRMLRDGQHSMVVSFVVICEIVSALWEPRADAVVTRTMNRLEELPVLWIDSANLQNKEVQHAWCLFQNRAPYVALDPLVPSFIDTIVNPPPELRRFVNYPLAEAVFDLWRGRGFDPRQMRVEHVAIYRQIMADERNLMRGQRNRERAKRELFRRKTKERLMRAEGMVDEAVANEFAGHVVDDPHYCPAGRLVFEMFHAIIENVQDQLDEGDIDDLAHIYAVPYVDLFTVDRRMMDYLNRASHRIGIPYQNRAYSTIRELLPLL